MKRSTTDCLSWWSRACLGSCSHVTSPHPVSLCIEVVVFYSATFLTYVSVPHMLSTSVYMVTFVEFVQVLLQEDTTLVLLPVSACPADDRVNQDPFLWELLSHSDNLQHASPLYMHAIYQLHPLTHAIYQIYQLHPLTHAICQLHPSHTHLPAPPTDHDHLIAHAWQKMCTLHISHTANLVPWIRATYKP